MIEQQPCPAMGNTAPRANTGKWHMAGKNNQYMTGILSAHKRNTWYMTGISGAQEAHPVHEGNTSGKP